MNNEPRPTTPDFGEMMWFLNLLLCALFIWFRGHVLANSHYQHYASCVQYSSY